MPHVMSIPKFERFFRVGAGVDIDKSDIARYEDFINREIEGLENIERFRKFDTEIELRPVLDTITIRCRVRTRNESLQRAGVDLGSSHVSSKN